MIVRDGGRTLTGETLGELAPRADRVAGGRLVSRGVVRLFNFEGEREFSVIVKHGSIEKIDEGSRNKVQPTTTCHNLVPNTRNEIISNPTIHL